MLGHGIKSLAKVRRLAVAGLVLPLPLIIFSVYVFDHYLKGWYRDPFVLGILLVFLAGQGMAVRENILMLRGVRKCVAFLRWLQGVGTITGETLLPGLATQPDGHLRNVVENATRISYQEGGNGVQSVLDSAANRRTARDGRALSLQTAVNRTTLKLGFLGTLIGLLLTFTPMKDAILALRNSGGEMKFVTDIAKAIDGDYFAIYTTLLATGLSLLIEMITLQLLERGLGRFEMMNSFVDEWVLVELEPRLQAGRTCSAGGVANLQEQLAKNQEALARAVADTTRRIEDVLRVQEALGNRVDRLLAYDRDSLLVLDNRLGAKDKA